MLRTTSFKRILAFGSFLGISALSTAQSFPPAFSKSATYVAGDIVQYGGNWYRAMTAITADGAYPAAAYGKWELNFVRSNTTLTVGADQMFGNLIYAWTFARNARIGGTAYLHIDIVTTKANFSETFTGSFSLDHPSGNLISVLGDNLSNINLTFASGDGFVLDTGNCLAAIGGMTLNQANPSSGVGFSVNNSASISNLNNVQVNNFAVAIVANNNAMISAESVISDGCSSGISADANSTVSVSGYTYFSSGSNGGALSADHGSTISAGGCELTNNKVSGKLAGTAAMANDNAVIDMSSGTATNWQYGAIANDGGRVRAFKSTFTNTTDWAYVSQCGEVDGTGSATSGGQIIGTNDGSYVFN